MYQGFIMNMMFIVVSNNIIHRSTGYYFFEIINNYFFIRFTVTDYLSDIGGFYSFISGESLLRIVVVLYQFYN